MVSQAEVIKDLIKTNWNLTGDLSKVGTDTMQEIVYFFDRAQVLGNEKTKAIEVIKINDDLRENVTEHPNFTEVEDVYEITMRYRVTDVDESPYDDALNNVELMANEVLDILDTQFSPATSSSGFFVSSKTMRKDDHLDQAQPELKRILALRLTQIRPNVDTVFRGNTAVMIFDTSASKGSNKPGSDYTYTELRELSIVEGFDTVPHLTKDKARGRGIPHLVRGLFHGVFSALLYAKKADIDGATLEKIELLYKTQLTAPLASQLAEIVMLHNTTDIVTPTPDIFTTKSYMRITQMDKLTSDVSLVSYRIIGRLTQPSEYSMGT